MSKLLPLAVGVATVASLGVPATSGAAGFNCDASALRVTLVGKASEPVTANRGAATCANDTKSLNGTAFSALSGPLGLSVLPVNAGAVVASTQVSGTAPGPTQKALATGGVANLAIPLATLPSLVTLPVPTLPAVPALTVPITPVKSALTTALGPAAVVPPVSTALAALPASATVDISSALNGLLAGVSSGLKTGDLLDVAGAIAYAGGACNNGQPGVAGSSTVAGIKVLGQSINLGSGYNQSVPLIDTASIDPSNIAVALSSLGLDSTVISTLDTATSGLATSLINGAIRSALDALPNINVLPATAAQVKLTPGSQTTVGNKLTQQALSVTVSLLGQTLIDGVIGEATATKDAVDCAAPTVTAAGAALQCTTRRLVLTNVLQSGSRVKLEGAADARYIGKTVSIVFEHTGRVVAKAVVDKAGNFATTAPMPSAKLASTNSARYIAELGKEKSLDLKLQRRMILISETSKSGKVTITGRVTRPLGSPVQTITLSRRVSCKHTEVVKRFKPNGDGTFKVTIANPKNAGGAAVYRLGTKVRKTVKNPKLFPTFTLPKAVTLSS